MKNLLTVIYYTSNQEDEAFENKIKARLLKVIGDLPLISVSQKPINFGKNICVGEVGACDANLFRQIQIGCETATTPFVISAEADCLYPPEYFKFIPKNTKEYYRFENLYILYQWGHGEASGFYKKDTGPFAQVTGKELYIKMIQNALKDNPKWNKPEKRIRIPLFLDRAWKVVPNKNPIVNLKTYKGMRRWTKTIGKAVPTIPYWGRAPDLRKELWG